MKTGTSTVILAAAAAAVLLTSSHAGANETRRKLEAGAVLVTSVRAGGGVKAGRAMTMVNATPKQVYKVITQVQHYREFVPRMVGSEKVDKGLWLLKSNLPWPAKDSWAQVKMIKGKRNGVYIIKWTMERGTFKKFEGTAWIQPAGKGRSMLTYQLLAVPDTIAPDALLSKVMKQVTEDMTYAIRDRVDDLIAGRVAAGSKVASK